jgi:hypothetical protein
MSSDLQFSAPKNQFAVCYHDGDSCQHAHLRSAVENEINNSIDSFFTLGVGAKAGSITNENVGLMHLINIKALTRR